MEGHYVFSDILFLKYVLILKRGIEGILPITPGVI